MKRIRFYFKMRQLRRVLRLLLGEKLTLKYEHKRFTPNVRDTKFDHNETLRNFDLLDDYTGYVSAKIILIFDDNEYTFFIKDDAKIKFNHNNRLLEIISKDTEPYVPYNTECISLSL